MQNLLDFKPAMASVYKMVVNYTGVPNEAGFLLNALKTLLGRQGPRRGRGWWGRGPTTFLRPRPHFLR